ncbi:MAG: hypothetical protein ACOYIS_07665, partial [Candidatus Cloacimonadaceae bacterium]
NFFDPNEGIQTGQNTLSHFIKYNTELRRTNYHYLADLLFSEDERNMNMDQGYRGIPSIGSVLMTKVQEQKFWPVIKESMINDKSSKAFIMGSVFGGTGASGYPVISQLLRKSAPNSKIGGVLMLPYFKLQDANNLLELQPELKEESILPDSNSFIINAKTACQFYGRHFDSNDSNYVLGDDFDLCKTYDKYAIGSEGQNNDAHFIELIAALACLDFEQRPENNYQKYYNLIVNSPTTPNGAPTIEARDLPVDGDTLIKQFEKFSLLYHFIEDLYDSIDKEKLNMLDKMAWLRKLSISNRNARGRDLIEIKDQIYTLKKFLIRYKTWMTQMHTNTPDLKIQDSNLRLSSLLVNNTEKYKGFDITSLDIQLNRSKPDQDNLFGAMLEMMSQARMIKGGE